MPCPFEPGVMFSQPPLLLSNSQTNGPPAMRQKVTHNGPRCASSLRLTRLGAFAKGHAFIFLPLLYTVCDSTRHQPEFLSPRHEEEAEEERKRKGGKGPSRTDKGAPISPHRCRVEGKLAGYIKGRLVSRVVNQSVAGGEDGTQTRPREPTSKDFVSAKADVGRPR